MRKTIVEINPFFRLFNFSLELKFSLTHNRTAMAIGTYSICNDGKHVIYLDYDKFRIEWLKDELRYLQKEYNLSSFSDSRPNTNIIELSV